MTLLTRKWCTVQCQGPSFPQCEYSQRGESAYLWSFFGWIHTQECITCVLTLCLISSGQGLIKLWTKSVTSILEQSCLPVTATHNTGYRHVLVPAPAQVSNALTQLSCLPIPWTDFCVRLVWDTHRKVLGTSERMDPDWSEAGFHGMCGADRIVG